MSTCPSTPPRRIRVETPEAPLHGIIYDKGKKQERREKEKEKERQKEEEGQKDKPRGATRYRPNPSASISFALSPPGSPVSTGLPSPAKEKLDIFRDNTVKFSSDADPFTGPSFPSSTKHKKFKPPPAPSSVKNPFSSQEPAQQSNGAGPLPTPAKTPSKKRKFTIPSEEQDELDSTTKVLFPNKTPQKPASVSPAAAVADILEQSSFTSAGARKQASNVLDLESDGDVFGNPGIPGNGAIEIYTDSNARVPEYDPSQENPFIDRPESSARGLSDKALKKARKLREKIEKSREEFETLKGNREDGMVYILYDVFS
jgi:hypothetical protein